jgi:TDG/mug DNA glycosylase family protein
MRVHSLAPVVDARSRVLVLGSMPGRVSLRAREYYAHPRNLFWHLMEDLLAVPRSAPYAERLACLLGRRVGLWDVLKTCTRATSLDSDIVASSIVPNDLWELLAAHPSIRVVCFNGAKAASSFRAHVLPSLRDSGRIAFHDLPSTSPANASIPLETKRAAWRVVARAAGRAEADAARGAFPQGP